MCPFDHYTNRVCTPSTILHVSLMAVQQLPVVIWPKSILKTLYLVGTSKDGVIEVGIHIQSIIISI
jgi:hypothetical protein